MIAKLYHSDGLPYCDREMQPIVVSVAADAKEVHIPRFIGYDQYRHPAFAHMRFFRIASDSIEAMFVLADEISDEPNEERHYS